MRRATTAALLIVVAGCGRTSLLDGRVPSRDAAVAIDASVPGDASVPDLASAPDLAVFDGATQEPVDASTPITCPTAPSGSLIWGYGADNLVISRAVLDQSGNVVLAGGLRGPTSFAGVSLTSLNDSMDLFVAKLDPSGNVIFAKLFGDNDEQGAYGVDLDADGNIYLSGYLTGTMDVPPSGHLVSDNAADGFVMKLDSNGNYVWSQKIGRAGPSFTFAQPFSIDVDQSTGDVITSGRYGGAVNLPSGTPPADGNFVIRYDAAGTPLWSRAFTAYEPFMHRQAIDPQGHVIVAGDMNWYLDTTGQGNTSGPGVLTAPCAMVLNGCPGRGFLIELDPLGNIEWSVLLPPPPTGFSSVNGIAFDGVRVVGGGGYGVPIGGSWTENVDVWQFTLPNTVADFQIDVTNGSMAAAGIVFTDDGKIVAAAQNTIAFHPYTTLMTLDDMGNVLGSTDYGYMPGFPHSYPTTLARRQCEQVVAGYMDGTMTIPNADGGTTMLTVQQFVPGGAFVMRVAP